MKQKSIKFLSAFLSLLMVFSVFAMVPMTASAAEANLAEGMTKVSTSQMGDAVVERL